MALWDVMQNFGTVVLNSFPIVTFILDKPVFNDTFAGILEVVDTLKLNPIVEAMALYGFDAASLTWGHLIFGSVLLLMGFSVAKWVLDLFF